MDDVARASAVRAPQSCPSLVNRHSPPYFSNRHKWELEIELTCRKQTTRQFSNRLKTPYMQFAFSQFPSSFFKFPSLSIASIHRTEIDLTPSQQTTKYFSIANFEPAFRSPALHRNHAPEFLIDTLAIRNPRNSLKTNDRDMF